MTHPTDISASAAATWANIVELNRVEATRTRPGNPRRVSGLSSPLYSCAPKSQRRVLRLLARRAHAGPAGDWTARLTVDQIAQGAGVHVHTVLIALNALQAQGLIDTAPCQFRLHVENGEQL